MQGRKPRALDLFCGAGGASMGLHRAGFDVTGVDIKPQPRYPFQFIQADALRPPVDLSSFDFIWASPPCQAFSKLRFMPDAKEHPNLIPETRAMLVESGVAFAIENVEDAPLGETGNLILLCGTMFGLQTSDGRAELWRHRLFETSFPILLRPQCQHRSPALGVYGGHVRDRCRNVLTVVGHTPVDNTWRSRRAITVTGHTAQTNTVRNRERQTYRTEDAKQAMGIEWMTMAGLSQAIPPAYSEFIGRAAMPAIAATEATA
jgi:DNA (cytosine-5)-methyltransferase 1